MLNALPRRAKSLIVVTIVIRFQVKYLTSTLARLCSRAKSKFSDARYLLGWVKKEAGKLSHAVLTARLPFQADRSVEKQSLRPPKKPSVRTPTAKKQKMNSKTTTVNTPPETYLKFPSFRTTFVRSVDFALDSTT